MAAATGDQQVTLTLTAGGAITDQDTASEGAGNENLVGGAINLTADSIGEADPSVTDPTAIEAAAIDTDATILNVTTTGGGIFIDETNAVGLGRLVAGTAGNRKDITLTTGGAITDQNTTAEGVGNEDPVGGAITLQAGSGIGMPGDADIDTAVTSIDAQTTSGGIFIDETSNLALGRVDAGAGDITVKAGGTITDNTAAEGAGNENLAGGAVTLRSASGIGVMGEATDIDIVADNIDAEITGSTGDVSIAKTGTVELGSTTRVAAGTEDGSIQVTAGDAMTVVQDISTAGSGEIILTSADGNLQINDGVTVQASGSAKLTAAGNVALGRIEAGTDADRKDITITAGSAITDNNSAVKADGREEENLVGGDISLTAATGIGEPGATPISTPRWSASTRKPPVVAFSLMRPTA